jgi:hypothetical protein
MNAPNPMKNQRRWHQRNTPTLLGPALDDHHRGGRHERHREQRPDPRRPVQHASLGERDEQRDDRDAEQRRTGQVHRGWTRGTGRRDVAPREGQHGDADRNVHQEDRPPREPGDVGMHDQTAQQLAHRGGDATDRRVQADRPRTAVTVQGGLERRDHLRLAQGGRQPLGDPRGDQHSDVRRDAAEQRGNREPDDAGNEQALPPDRIPEATTDDEHQRICGAVAGDHQLEHGCRGVQGRVHRGQRDIDDEEVEYRQERSAEQDDQPDGAQRGGRPLRLREHGDVVDDHLGLAGPVHLRGHDDQRAPQSNLVPEVWLSRYKC